MYIRRHAWVSRLQQPGSLQIRAENALGGGPPSRFGMPHDSVKIAQITDISTARHRTCPVPTKTTLGVLGFGSSEHTNSNSRREPRARAAGAHMNALIKVEAHVRQRHT